jgi:hypothetical protein
MTGTRCRRSFAGGFLTGRTACQSPLAHDHDGPGALGAVGAGLAPVEGTTASPATTEKLGSELCSLDVGTAASA